MDSAENTRDWHSSHIDLLQCLLDQVPEGVLDCLHATGEIKDIKDEHCIRATCRRFLIAEKLDIKAAALRLERHSKWRQNILPNGCISEACIMSEIESYKVFLQPPGSDGRPIIIVKAARHYPNDINASKRFIIYCLETASRLCDLHASKDHKLWAIFDLEGLKWANLDYKALKSSFQVLSSAFPERVHKIYMINAPIIFDSLWKVVSPFIDPVSRSKVRFIFGANGMEELQRNIDKKTLPRAYGGLSEEILVHNVARELGVSAFANEVSEIQSKEKKIQSSISFSEDNMNNDSDPEDEAFFDAVDAH